MTSLCKQIILKYNFMYIFIYLVIFKKNQEINSERIVEKGLKERKLQMWKISFTCLMSESLCVLYDEMPDAKPDH